MKLTDSLTEKVAIALEEYAQDNTDMTILLDNSTGLYKNWHEDVVILAMKSSDYVIPDDFNIHDIDHSLSFQLNFSYSDLALLYISDMVPLDNLESELEIYPYISVQNIEDYISKHFEFFNISVTLNDNPYDWNDEHPTIEWFAERIDELTELDDIKSYLLESFDIKDRYREEFESQFGYTPSSDEMDYPYDIKNLSIKSGNVIAPKLFNTIKGDTFRYVQDDEFFKHLLDNQLIEFDMVINKDDDEILSDKGRSDLIGYVRLTLYEIKEDLDTVYFEELIQPVLKELLQDEGFDIEPHSLKQHDYEARIKLNESDAETMTNEFMTRAGITTDTQVYQYISGSGRRVVDFIIQYIKRHDSLNVTLKEIVPTDNDEISDGAFDNFVAYVEGDMMDIHEYVEYTFYYTHVYPQLKLQLHEAGIDDTLVDELTSNDYTLTLDMSESDAPQIAKHIISRLKITDDEDLYNVMNDHQSSITHEFVHWLTVNDKIHVKIKDIESLKEEL